jgi:parallel beta-helix repeat protein
LNDGAQGGVELGRPFIVWKIYNNTVYNCQAANAMNLEASGGIAIDYNANNAEVYHNLIYNNWGKGIYIYNADNVTAWGNIVYGNDAGIVISADATLESANNNSVYNNVFYSNWNNQTYGPNYNAEIVFGLRDNSTFIKNNIIYANNSGYAYLFYNSSSYGSVVDYNIVYNTSVNVSRDVSDGFLTWANWKSYGFDAHGHNLDPIFVDKDGRNFRVNSSSPAVNVGTSVGLTYDFAGTSLPQDSGYDIGAYEFIPVSVVVDSPKGSSPSGGSPSSSSGTTSSWANTYIAPKTDKADYYVVLSSGDRVKVDLGDWVKYVGVISINGESALIEISSSLGNSQKSISVGANGKFDTNNDNFYDVEVRVERILEGKVSVNIKKINEEIVQQIEKQEGTEVKPKEALWKNKTFLIISGIVVVLGIVLAMFSILKMKRRRFGNF